MLLAPGLVDLAEHNLVVCITALDCMFLLAAPLQVSLRSQHLVLQDDLLNTSHGYHKAYGEFPLKMKENPNALSLNLVQLFKSMKDKLRS